MTPNRYLLFFVFSLITAGSQAQLSYPAAPRTSAADTAFGIRIEDPYRWMENPGDTSMRKWLDAQKQVTKQQKDQFRNFNITYTNIEKFAEVDYKNVIRKGKYYFAYQYLDRNSSPALYYTDDIDAEGMRLLVDPSKIIKSSRHTYSIEDFEVSEDNTLLAFSLSESGSDWREIHVVNLKTGIVYPDKVEWVKFSDITWHKNGFYYKRYANQSANRKYLDPATGATLCYHRAGTDAYSDSLVYVPEIRGDDFSFSLSSNGEYILLKHHMFRKGKPVRTISCLYADSVKEQKPVPFIILSAQNESNYEIIDCSNDTALIFTDHQAPRGCIYKYALKGVNQGRLFIPEYLETIQEVYTVSGRLFCAYYKDGRYAYVIFDESGKVVDQNNLPDGTCIGNVSYNRSESEIIFYKNSFLYPAIVYSLNVKTLKLEAFGDAFVNYSAGDYVSEVKTYIARDSTVIPIYITYKKGLKLNGNNPTILYGYGGFGVSAKPYFDPMYLYFMSRGGVLAVPAIRGGGEYGRAWHDAGRKLNKQVSFNDFIDAAEFLFAQQYTSPSKLALKGGSNGGLLLGAVITQRPDICKVAIPVVGVFDMLRFHKYTVGPFHTREFGDIGVEAEFKYVYAYSPLHHIKHKVNYPATLFITGDRDDRVPPFQTYKFLASLQQAGGTNPYVLYVADKSGHAAGETWDERFYQKAFIMSFVFQQLDIK